jgi:HAD superfamily phosphatase (TIGR01668 family)
VPLLKPDLYYSAVGEVDLAALASSGVRWLLVDLDNTLLPRDTGELPPSAFEFADRVHEAGMDACLVSNNWHGRVSAVAAELGFDYVSKALKPLPFAFLTALDRMGGERHRAAVIGDQIFTDILGGNLLEMRTVLVSPLSRSDLPHTLLLRKLEARVLSKRAPIA